MALTTPPAITVDGSGTFSVTGDVQQGTNLPGTSVASDTVALLTNVGPSDIAVAIGSTATPQSNGIILKAGQSEYVGTGGVTTFSAVQLNSLAPSASTLYVTTGS